MSAINLDNIKSNSIEFNNTNFMYFEKFFQTEILGGHIQKVQALSTENQFFKIKIRKDKENKDLIIGQGVCLLSNLKTEAKSENKGFALTLSNKLENRQIKSIKQINLEKILLFEFVDCKLYCEFFSSNNIILTNNENKIISCLIKEEWKDRKIGRNQIYILPKNESKNIFEYTPKEEDLEYTKNLVSNIIKNVNVFPALIEKYLINKKIDKNVFDFKLYKTSIEEIKKIYSNLLITKTKIILKENKNIFINLNLDFIDTIDLDLNTLINELILKKELYSQSNQVLKKYNKDKKNIEHILDEQLKAKEKILQKANKSKMIGDYIYNNFELLEKMRFELKPLIEHKKSVDEIKEKIEKINKEFGTNLKYEKVEKEKQKIVFLIQ